MSINFHLSEAEAAVRSAAASFAQIVLKPIHAEYMKQPEHHKRFQATQPVYETAVAGGLIKAHVSPPLGGTGGPLVQATIMVEECYAVEPAAALTIFSTGLGLMPFNIVQSQTHRSFLEPFLSSEGAPLAALAFSEPGGVANYLEKGAPGLNTTARREGEEWIINGEKMWATNCAGWDFGGADLACVVCRDITEGEPGVDAEPRDRIMILLVTRADIERNGGEKCFQVKRHISLAGHTATSGPHIQYTNIRVPAANLLCPPGTAAPVVSACFDFTAVLVGAMSVGLMRAAFEKALAFAKADNRRGAVLLLERQAVADLLSGIKVQTEACRALTWKAAGAMDSGPGDYEARRELAQGAKVYCSEAAVKAITDAMSAVGITSYDTDQGFAEMLGNALALPIFDGGNVGVRRRHLQQIMLSPTYDPWAATFGPTKAEKKNGA